MKHIITLFVMLITLLLPIGTALSAETRNNKADVRHDLEAAFMKLCDMASHQLALDVPEKAAPEKAVWRKPYYQDSYSVRALAVAYDITGKPKYLKACQKWADDMVQYQGGMNPSGAYYMNYGRKPGESTGDWYVADAASIAMGVFATSVRSAEPETKARYLRSVRAFADLVIARYRRGGGITDGIWDKHDGPWWCSTGIFGSLAFLLYNECGEGKYLDAGFEAVDWLNGQNGERTLPASSNISPQGPSFIMYFFEAHSAGLQYMLPNTERHQKTWRQIEEAKKWMQSRFHHPGSSVDPANYKSQWGSKIGGMPFHLYVWSRYRPQSFEYTDMADMELKYITSVILDDKRFAEGKYVSQLMNFTMLSLAERLSPGSVYRR